MYQSIWKYASYTEVKQIMYASGILAILHTVLITLLFCRMPISYYVVGIAIQFMLLTAVRFAYRFVTLEWNKNVKLSQMARASKVMLIGAGQAGQMILRDLRFIQEFRPQMVGIGPFIPHKDTMYRDEKAGSAALTLRLLAILRLMLPDVLLPATTALGTVLGDGRQQGMLHGCNVVMPNLSPENVRQKYALYDNKLSFGAEAAESVQLLKASMAAIGHQVVTDRGDWKGEGA
jgi:hypothetical protein